MPDFTKRSYQKELLDRDDIPFKDISRNMRELDIINTQLGGHNITIAGLKKLLDHSASKKDSILVCEIGCGGGDNLKAIDRYCKKKNLSAKFIGVDINPDCIEHAKQHCVDLPVEWIASDYRTVEFRRKPDIIFSSLFCHHFNDEDLVFQLKWMQENSAMGFFINDLHRNPIAYYSIKIITSAFSKSYLVKNDAPLSVLRGFSKNEWKDIAEEAGIDNVSLQWKWAFRWLLVALNFEFNAGSEPQKLSSELPIDGSEPGI